MHFHDYKPSLTDADKATIRAARDLLRQAAADADKISADVTGWIASVKGAVTGTDTATIRAGIATMRKAADSTIAAADRLLADPATTHDRAVDYVRSARDIANIDELRNSAARNSLLKLASDVGAASVADLGSLLKIGLPIAIGVAALVFFASRRR